MVGLGLPAFGAAGSDRAGGRALGHRARLPGRRRGADVGGAPSWSPAHAGAADGAGGGRRRRCAGQPVAERLRLVESSRGARAWGWARSAWPARCSSPGAPRGPLHDSVVGWWYSPDWPGHAAGACVYVGHGDAGGGLVGPAAPAAAAEPPGGCSPSRALWIAPLALAPPLFSRDLYSYLAQGTLLHLGHSPYHVAPVALAGLGHGHVLDAVSPFWRHTTAPYGPLFLELVSLVVGITGRHLIAGVLLARAWSSIGVVLHGGVRPAAHPGAGDRRPPRAVADRGQPADGPGSGGVRAQRSADGGAAGGRRGDRAVGSAAVGIAVCAVAATIKVPALVGAVFIAVAWARAAERSPRGAALSGHGAAIVVGGAGGGHAWPAGWASAGCPRRCSPRRPRSAWRSLPGPASATRWRRCCTPPGSRVSAAGDGVGLRRRRLRAVGAAGLVLLWRVRVGRLVGLLGLTLVVAAAGRTGGLAVVLLLGAGDGRGAGGLAAIAGAGGGARAGRVSRQAQRRAGDPAGAAPAVLAVESAIAGVASAPLAPPRSPAPARRRPGGDPDARARRRPSPRT